MMYYVSTRGGGQVKASYAILNSLADDGGLYFPQEIINISVASLLDLDYQAIALKILSIYFDEFTIDELQPIIENAYDLNHFKTINISEIVSFNNYSFLELFHGKTAAFKDLALSIYPFLLNLAKKYQNDLRKIMIITATSGDTGKAAMEALADLNDIDICVLYPEEGVSDIQKLQMKTQKGNNIYLYGIKGNFDDAQTLVKEMFDNKVVNKALESNDKCLSSANSINIARLLPQVVYYFDAYVRLVRGNEIKLGDLIDVYVPTGNFGNILALIIAKNMGLMINKVICATNDNNILDEFITNGVYDLRTKSLHKTYSPSMDILISSNLERLLFLLFGPEVTKLYMDNLKQNNYFYLSSEQLEVLKTYIISDSCSNEKCLEVIKNEFDKNSYLLDPHTATALSAYNNFKFSHYSLIVSTASPYKFYDSINKAFSIEEDGYYKLQSLTNTIVPNCISDLHKMSILHNDTINTDEFEHILLEIINREGKCINNEKI